MSLPETSLPLSDDLNHPKLQKYAGEKVPNGYIVIFEEGATDEQRRQTFPQSVGINYAQFFDLDLSDPSDDNGDLHNNEPNAEIVCCASGPF